VTDLFWASVITAPAAFVVYVPFATHLYAVQTGSRPGRWVHSLLGEPSDGAERSRGSILWSIAFVVLSQIAATSLVLSGLTGNPSASIALACGLGEWAAALAWLGFLRATSSPADHSSR
jgi:hypothetical protein